MPASRVDGEQRPVLVREAADLGDREDLPGDVARARDRDDADGTMAILQRASQVGEQLLRQLGRLEKLDARQTPPGQHVRVVLDDRAEHRVAWPQDQAVGQQVDRLGRVSDKNDCI